MRGDELYELNTLSIDIDCRCEDMPKSQCAAFTLLPELLVRVASYLEPNEVACDLRLVNKYFAESLRDWTTVRLSRPVPHHACARRWGGAGSTRELTFGMRAELLRMVARSGIIPNLALEAAECHMTDGCRVWQDGSTVAAAEGHIHVIGTG